jgi:hypothetical protein
MFGLSKARKAATLDKRVFKETSFVNPDVGPLNEALDVDCFVLSIPKCGTTAIQRGLERLGRKVIHAHTNVSTYVAFPNGDELRNNGLGMETILKARLSANSRPVHIFFGYREPVSWYLSLAAFFGLSLDAPLRDNIIQNIEGLYPWTNYRIDDIAWILREATGINILEQSFDHARGYSVFRKSRSRLITYRFDRLDSVRDYIVENLDKNFVLTRERVNHDPAYDAYKGVFLPPAEALERLYRDRWFQHFYTQSERNAWIKTHSRRKLIPVPAGALLAGHMQRISNETGAEAAAD